MFFERHPELSRPEVAITRQDVAAFVRSLETSPANDSNELIDVLRAGELNGELDFCYDVDAENRLKTVAWFFREQTGTFLSLHQDDRIVTFDNRCVYCCFRRRGALKRGRYKSNRFGLQFGIFAGVQGNGRSTTYGFSLSADETICSFQFIFNSFKGLMGEPSVLFTDADVAMQSAARACFPGAKHLWCQWHCVMAASKHRPGDPSFRGRLWNLMHLEHPALVWEALEKLKSEYPTAAPYITTYLSRNIRMWSSAFRHDVFCAAMSSTQRGESLNALTKLRGLTGAHSLATFPQHSRDIVTEQKKLSDEYGDANRTGFGSDRLFLRELQLQGLSQFALNLLCTEVSQVEQYSAIALCEFTFPSDIGIDAAAVNDLIPKRADGEDPVVSAGIVAMDDAESAELERLACTDTDRADDYLEGLRFRVRTTGGSLMIYLRLLGFGKEYQHCSGCGRRTWPRSPRNSDGERCVWDFSSGSYGTQLLPTAFCLLRRRSLRRVLHGTILPPEMRISSAPRGDKERVFIRALLHRHVRS